MEVSCFDLFWFAFWEGEVSRVFPPDLPPPPSRRDLFEIMDAVVPAHSLVSSVRNVSLVSHLPLLSFFVLIDYFLPRKQFFRFFWTASASCRDL